MNSHPVLSLVNLPLSVTPHRLSVGILKGPEHKALTELIARLALRGPFHLIAGSEWLPDQDTLKHAVRWYTTAVKETLDHPILGRPSTYLQMYDQLISAESQNHPILVLDLLHFFYDPDIDLTLRQYVLKQCCHQLRHLARSRSVLVLVQCLPIEEYPSFLQILSSVADEILEAQKEPMEQASQIALLEANNGA